MNMRFRHKLLSGIVKLCVFMVIFLVALVVRVRLDPYGQRYSQGKTSVMGCSLTLTT